jgi:hypothetical protein
MGELALNSGITLSFRVRLLLFSTLLLITAPSCHYKSQDEMNLAPVSDADRSEMKHASGLHELEARKNISDNEFIADEPETDQAEERKEENLAQGVRKLIKTGTMSLKAGDMDSCKTRIDKVLRSLGAYYEKEDLINNESGISYDLSIRVRPESFEKLVAEIERSGHEVISKSVRISDASDEYIDIQSRIANKRVYLKRYRELLSKAATIKNILEIEEIIRTLQEELESQEQRLVNLNNAVVLSTLTLELKKDKEFVYNPEPEEAFSERIKQSFLKSINAILDFILWIIGVWPQLLVSAVILVVAWRRIRRYLQQEEQTKPS